MDNEQEKKIIDLTQLPVVDFDEWTRQWASYSMEELAEKINNGELGVANAREED